MSRRQSLRLDWRRGNVRDLRVKYEHACRVMPEGAHEWRVIETDGRRIRVLIHQAEPRDGCAIIYFHGGGWMFGSPSTHADITARLAAVTRLPVISVDYRLAPEHKARAAVADGLAVLGHCLNALHGAVILAGDSAGGALALAVERHAARRRTQIAGVCSIYGSFGHAHHPRGTARDGLDPASLKRYWLAANGSTGGGPYSIPALADRSGCPVHLVVAGRDPLRDDSLALARALTAKGRPVTVDMHPFEGHSFLQQPYARRTRQITYGGIAEWIGKLSIASDLQAAIDDDRLAGDVAGTR